MTGAVSSTGTPTISAPPAAAMPNTSSSSGGGGSAGHRPPKALQSPNVTASRIKPRPTTTAATMPVYLAAVARVRTAAVWQSRGDRSRLATGGLCTLGAGVRR